MNIKGQAAIVTGGGSGLGAATVTAARYESGAKVAILDVNFRGQLREVAARTGGHPIKCDVSDEASAIAALAEARATNGGVRLLVNCAGIGGAKRIVGKDGPMPLADFTRIINVNLIPADF